MCRSFVIAWVLIAQTAAAAQIPAPATAQSPVPSATVANADIVAMAKARLSDDVIVGAIDQASTVDFDLAPPALIALKEAGVSDVVIKAMQDRHGKTGATPGVAAAPAPAPAPAAVAGEPCRIFITEEDPPSRFYTMVRKEVQDGKKWYGSHDEDLMYKLARQADKVGADAVIAFHEWRAPSAWSWAAAKAGGMAVTWTAEGKAAVPAMKGQCWSPDKKK